MKEKTLEYVRSLLSKARGSGVTDDELLNGKFVSQAESIEDASSILSDRGFYIKSEDLLWRRVQK